MNLTERDCRKYFEHYFPNVRPRENGEASIRCPFHADKNPSCTISLTKGQWYCHAGCGGGGIIAFELRKNGGSWEEAGERVAKIIGHSVKGVAREIATVYPWTDEEGKLLYEHVRYVPKDFRWRRPNGNGGYVWSLGKVQRVLFNLPEVVKAERVFLCEGEKDVEALQALGLPATTSGDAPNSRRDEFAECLRGKDVVALPDNDAPGCELMERAARSLHGVARSLKVVALPGLADNEDVSDFCRIIVPQLARRPTQGELQNIVRHLALSKDVGRDNKRKSSLLTLPDSGLVVTIREKFCVVIPEKVLPLWQGC